MIIVETMSQSHSCPNEAIQNKNYKFHFKCLRNSVKNKLTFSLLEQNLDL